MPGQAGQSCFMVVLIHTLPTDFKDFMTQEVGLDNLNSRCKIIPVSIVPNGGFSDSYTALMASMVPNQDVQTWTTIEAGLKGVYYHNASPGLDAFLENLSDNLVSYMCSVESRVQCFMSKHGWVPSEEEEVAFERGIEDDFFVTPSPTTVTTNDWTTVVTEPFVKEEGTDRPDPVWACCGSMLGAEQYDTNVKSCCGSQAQGFVVADSCEDL